MRTAVGAGGYGIEMRERIVDAVQDGETRDRVAQRFGVHYQTVDVYCIKAELGTLNQTRKPTGRPRLILEHHETQVFKQLREFSDATLEEHTQMLFEATGFKTSKTTIYRLFARNDITFKKKRSSPASREKTSESTS